MSDAAPSVEPAQAKTSNIAYTGRFLGFPFGIVCGFSDFTPKDTIASLPVGVAFTACKSACPDVSPILVQLFTQEMWRPTRGAVERQDLAMHPLFPVHILCTI